MSGSHMSPVSSNNGTSTPLAAAGEYTGTGEEVTMFSEISISMYAEPSTATGTLYFEFSQDGENWDVSIPTVISNPTVQVPIPLRVVTRWFRVRYVNDAVAQTAFRMQVMLHRSGVKTITRSLDTQILTTEPVEVTRAVLTGQDGAGNFNNVHVGEGGVLSVDEFLTEVALGNISGHSLHTQFGRNSDIDPGSEPETVWEGGGLYTGQPIHTASAETVTIVSSSALDTAAGTGARTATIYGLDENWALQSEEVTLNGLVAVTTTGQWHRVFRVEVETAGSGGSNAGVLTVAHSTTVTNVFAGVPVGKNHSQVAAYTVPASKTGKVMRIAAVLTRTNGSAGSGTLELLVREEGKVYKAVRVFEIQQGAGLAREINAAVSLPAKSDVQWRVTDVSDTNTVLTGTFEILLVDD